MYGREMCGVGESQRATTPLLPNKRYEPKTHLNISARTATHPAPPPPDRPRGRGLPFMLPGCGDVLKTELLSSVRNTFSLLLKARVNIRPDGGSDTRTERPIGTRAPVMRRLFIGRLRGSGQNGDRLLSVVYGLWGHTEDVPSTEVHTQRTSSSSDG